MFFFFFSSRRRHTRSLRDWSSDVCSSDLESGNVQSDRGPDDLVPHGLYGIRERVQRGGDGARGGVAVEDAHQHQGHGQEERSEERRVGKECRTRWWREQEKEKRKTGERVE